MTRNELNNELKHINIKLTRLGSTQYLETEGRKGVGVALYAKEGKDTCIEHIITGTPGDCANAAYRWVFSHVYGLCVEPHKPDHATQTGMYDHV